MPVHELDANKAALLSLWLEGKLTPEQRNQFEQLCLQDEEFSRRVEAANFMTLQGESYQDEAVPEWDRAATFEMPEHKKWWQWQGLPALSFATSMLAIVMVVTGISVRVDDGAMTISFARPVDQQQLDTLVSNKLNQFEQQQQTALLSFTDAMQQQQLQANSQLTNYLLNSSRQERREDFAELIKFINQQRSDDQLFFARQMNNLQQEIYQNPDYLIVPASNVLDSPLDSKPDTEQE